MLYVCEYRIMLSLLTKTERMMVTVYQVVSHILHRMGYQYLSEYVLTIKDNEIDLYINFIRSKFIKDKELVEFINYFL